MLRLSWSDFYRLQAREEKIITFGHFKDFFMKIFELKSRDSRTFSEEKKKKMGK